jgi:hypothetical protein
LHYVQTVAPPLALPNLSIRVCTWRDHWRLRRIPSSRLPRRVGRTDASPHNHACDVHANGPRLPFIDTAPAAPPTAGQMCLYFKRFDEAEAAYQKMGRLDLAVALRSRLGEPMRRSRGAGTGQ